MLVGVNEHEHRDHRQDEDHGKEEDYEEVDSKAGPWQPVGGLADLEADLRRPLAASGAVRGALVTGALDLVGISKELLMSNCCSSVEPMSCNK